MICRGRRKRRKSTFRHAQNASLKWMLEAAAEKLAASTQQLRAKIRGLGGEPVSTGLVNGAISLDDHAILAECERKQHMAKNA
jgi:hypothetical protein